MKRKPVAFLFLGETLLIPHLWPIAEALASLRPELAIDCWVATAVHEALLSRWSLALPGVRIRRVPGFLRVADAAAGRNPRLPLKLPMLARLAPRLLGARAVICAEQTSLWIPHLIPFFPAPFIKTSHGAGSMSARDDRRRRAARLMLVPSALERQSYLDRGFAPDRVVVTGYVKAGFGHRSPPAALFAEPRPILLYAPHWQRHRSSWWEWGRAIVAMLAEQRGFNVILAPHQRLIEGEPEAAAVLAAVAALPHIHSDCESFAMVDGSYPAAADLYLGDTSSQVVEYLGRPRPCVFLNPQRIDWHATPDHGFWTCGEVVDSLDRLPAALAEAAARHGEFVATQQAYAGAALGEAEGAAPTRCAEEILAFTGG